MTTTLATATHGMTERDPSVQSIIAAARSAQTQGRQLAPMRSAVLLAFTSAALLWAAFPPLNWSPLAWLAPVPWLMLCRLIQPTQRMYLACWLGGLAFYLPALQWMRLGDPLMYLAWLSLALYLAAYVPVTVWLCRVAVHRWSCPLVIAAPVVWVGGEFLKAHLLTGYAWYFLGHTQYRWLELIQISDLVGAYGVSAVIACSAAAVAALIPCSVFERLRLLPPLAPATEDGPHQTTPRATVTPASMLGVFVAAVLVASVIGYGFVRRGSAEFTPGPRVALIQGNFLASIRLPPEDASKRFLTHMRLTGMAVREQPDVIIWPEAMFSYPLFSAPAEWSEDDLRKHAPHVRPELWRDDSVRRTLLRESQQSGAALIYGIEGVDLTAEGIRQANSAVFVRPDAGISGKYDKIHLVPFGEYIPFKDLLSVEKIVPGLKEFGLHAGEQAAMFDYRGWRMAPVICFEDTVPHLVRHMVAAGSNREIGKPIDLLVNLSNDGWFHGSSGLDQHLITAAFRAVECRTPLVRAVNTGISAIIDGDGAIRDPEVFIDGDRAGRTTWRNPKTGNGWKQANCALVHTVPLDPRTSPYVRYGDWFASLCCGLTLLCAATSWTRRKVT